MIEGVRSVGIFVGDQDRAKDFYTNTLGFELVQDTPMGQEAGAQRWIEVAPPDRAVTLVLFTPEGQEDRIGTFQCRVRLRRRREDPYRAVGAGGRVRRQPRQEFWGWWASFKDTTATPTAWASAASNVRDTRARGRERP